MLELPTVESVSSSLLPTPTANQYEQDNDVLLSGREREKAKGRNGNGFGLTTANAVALLPPPQAADGDGGRVERTAAENGWKRPSGAKAAKPLGTAVALLPTPVTEPMTGNGHARNLGREVKLMPTPAAADRDRGPDYAAETREGTGGDSLTTTVAKLSGASTPRRSDDGKPSSGQPLDRPTSEAV